MGYHGNPGNWIIITDFFCVSEIQGSKQNKHVSYDGLWLLKACLKSKGIQAKVSKTESYVAITVEVKYW